MSETIGKRLDDGVSGNFGIVRAFACYTVVIFHAYGTTIAGFDRPSYPHFFGFAPDWLAVHVFFILSGMLLSHSLAKNAHFFGFVIGRLVRWMPAVILAALIMALALGPLVTTSDLSDYFSDDAFLHFFIAFISFADTTVGLPGVFEHNPIPSELFVPLWTMKYEILFSFALAALANTPLWKSDKLIIGASMVILVSWAYVFSDAGPHRETMPFDHMLRFGGAFALGICVYRLRSLILRDLRIVAALAAVAICASIFLPPLAPICGLILMAYAIAFGGTMRIKTPALILLIGTASYGIYVYAYPIQQLLAWLSPSLGPIGNGLWTMAFVTPVAIISWDLVERPLTGLRKRLFNTTKKPPETPTALPPLHPAQ